MSGDGVTRDFDTRRAVAFLGAASRYSIRAVRVSETVGRLFGEAGFTLVTGATTGLPQAASRAARRAGALAIGVSPAMSAVDHQTIFKRPLSDSDFVVFSGLGVEGRSTLMLRSVAAAVVVGGEVGTLGELCQAWLLGVPVIGILTSVPGLPRDMASRFARVTGYGSSILFDSDPTRLVGRIEAAVRTLGDRPRNVRAAKDAT